MSLLSSTRRALLGLVAGLPIFRVAQAHGPDAFTLTPQFQAGQGHEYMMTTLQRRQGAVSRHARSRVRLEVVAPHGDGWRLRWMEMDSELLEPPVPSSALADPWDRVAIDFFISAQGDFHGLADPEAMRARMEATVEGQLAQMALDPGNAPQMPQIRAAMRQFVDNPDFLGQQLLKQPKLLLGAVGRDYRVGEPLELRGGVPSPLGTGEIPMLARFNVRSADARRVSLGWLMVVDRQSTARTLAAELQPIMDAAQTEGQEALQMDAALAGFDFDERGDYVVDAETAWPLQVSSERRSAAGDLERVDSVELVRVPG
ncbi:hypothetical protein [Roseateles sp. LYH14W]